MKSVRASHGSPELFRPVYGFVHHGVPSRAAPTISSTAAVMFSMAVAAAAKSSAVSGYVAPWMPGLGSRRGQLLAGRTHLIHRPGDGTHHLLEEGSHTTEGGNQTAHLIPAAHGWQIHREIPRQPNGIRSLPTRLQRGKDSAHHVQQQRDKDHRAQN